MDKAGNLPMCRECGLVRRLRELVHSVQTRHSNPQSWQGVLAVAANTFVLT
jgi:hypothetical protein